MTKPSGSYQDSTSATDRPYLAEENRLTLDAMFSHPLPYLGWNRVVALFDAMGTVERRPNDEFAFRIGGEHCLVRKPHNEDLSAAEVVHLRHFIERAGLAPDPALPASHPSPDQPDQPAVPGLLVVMDHHEARVFHIDVSADDPAVHTIKPYDPHGFLHHLTHKGQSREHGQRAEEDPAFYEQIAQTIAAGGHIVVVGHGHGHSDAAHHLVEYLQAHHKEVYGRTVTEVVADLSSLTDPQLLDIGRRVLRAQAA